MASELAFAPADVVRSFPVGWYCPTVPIPPVAGPVKKKLVASVYLFADAVVAM